MPTVAVLGASEDRRKYGNKSLRAHRAEGYTVYPVNHRGGEVEGLPAYRRIEEVPNDLDVVTVYLPPPVTLEVLPEIATKGVREVVYFNPGSADDAVRRRARELGLPAKDACSIVALGRSPAEFP
jgi:hypothetical protein